MCVYLCVSAQSCPTLCDPMDCIGHQPPPWNSPGKEYWIGLPFPVPRDLPNPRIESASLVSPALAGGFFTTAPPGKPQTKQKKKKQVSRNHEGSPFAL